MKNVLIDFRTSETEKENLYKNGFNSIIVPPSGHLYNAVCGHPDMLLHIIDKKNIIVHKDMDTSFINIIDNLDYNVTKTYKSLKDKYPEDICLNALNTKHIFLHNLKYTDKNLLSKIKGKKLCDVKQGYSKCSTALISDSAAITSDIKIHNVLKTNGMKVLLLPPGDIELPGLNYGFIGGTCGILEEGNIAFFGDLNNYLYKNTVLKFLIQEDIRPIFLSKGKLIDRGTLFTL